jgi:hypothetical protein
VDYIFLVKETEGIKNYRFT